MICKIIKPWQETEAQAPVYYVTLGVRPERALDKLMALMGQRGSYIGPAEQDYGPEGFVRSFEIVKIIVQDESVLPEIAKQGYVTAGPTKTPPDLRPPREEEPSSAHNSFTIEKLDTGLY